MKISSHSNLILTILPQAGIGNKLSVWSRALVFSKHNNLELYTFGWVNFRPKNWLKFEFNKRFYFNDFRRLNIIELLSIILKFIFSEVKFNPSLDQLAVPNSIYVYTKYDHTFRDLKAHRQLIIDSFLSILSNHRLKEIEKLKHPLIGIHIRRDDFIKIGYDTPLSFYIQVLNQIRRITGISTPAIIYSDGLESELKDILSLPSVHLAIKKSDILDLFELSKSKILITSVGSSFSYWASFLSNGIVINYQNEWLQYIKSNANDDNSSEWYVDSQNKLPSHLEEQIKKQFI